MSLKDMRRTKGLTLQALAEQTGLHIVTLSRLETGKIDIAKARLKTVNALTKALNCTIEDLM